MTFKIQNTKINISLPFCLMVTFLLIVDTSGLMLISLLTVILHEIGHFVSMKRFGCAPKELKLSFYGVFIVSPSVYSSDTDKVTVALFGPLFNLIALIFSSVLFMITNYSYFLVFALVNFVFGFFNILPVRGLDGGTVLLNVMTKKCGQVKGTLIFNIISAIVIFFMILCGIYILLNGFKNPTLLLTGIYLALLNIIKL